MFKAVDCVTGKSKYHCRTVFEWEVKVNNETIKAGDEDDDWL